MPTPIKISVDEVQLDLFEEGKGLKVIGDFPGIECIDDLVVQIFEGKLTIITMPKSERKYQALAEIAEGLVVKSKEIRNGVMTLILGG